ncbi:tyrosine-type recombinase/integrase [Celeribacter halophilus]|uniref:Integrase n=1 Tax=Celeribacter halophilus TaxID=576117 RepID=A0A1I3NMC9_9RHOB|nr:integrase arm-type DNA-binding domain-containing protein [Celeribacter halophilus]PZX14567.1 integrase [Celeribacter halophilus]SFJ10349.1 Integrase [Celeribacter halophilus]
MPLTTKQIEAAKFGVSKERLPDGLGLYVRLYKSGTKTYETRVTCNDKRAWVQIGHFPDMSLKRARQIAGMVQIRIEEGLSLKQVRDALKAGDHSKIEDMVPASPGTVVIESLTFRELAKQWFDQKKLGLRNGKHIQQNWNTLETYIFPYFGDRPVTEVKVGDVIDAIRPIWHDKHETAKRVLGRVKEIFALAKIHEMRPDNPADFPPNTALGAVRKKTVHFGALPFEDIPALWEWLLTANCDEQTRHLVMLMILTAKRSKETRFARWDYFDMGTSIWTTPESLMKMSRLHRVPLSRQASAVLTNMRMLTGDAPFVFYKPKSKSRVICENAACNLLKKFRLGITAHGLRAGFRSWARKQGKYSHDAMEFALAHEQNSLEAAYQREDLIEERAIMMQDWADYVTGGANPLNFSPEESQK